MSQPDYDLLLKGVRVVRPHADAAATSSLVSFMQCSCAPVKTGKVL